MENSVKGEREQISIGDIATVLHGRILSRGIDMSGEGNVTTILTHKAITEGAINKGKLEKAVLSKGTSDERYYTREGDIVIGLSAPYAAAYVPQDMAGLLVSSFCAVIRVTENGLIDAKYLCALLNSSYVKKIFTAMVGVTSSPIVPISGIRDLKIPAVSAKDMKDIGEAFILSGQKQTVLSEIISAEKRLMESIVLASIKVESGNEQYNRAVMSLDQMNARMYKKEYCQLANNLEEIDQQLGIVRSRFL